MRFIIIHTPSTKYNITYSSLFWLFLAVLAISIVRGEFQDATLFVVAFTMIFVGTPLLLAFLLLNIMGLTKYKNYSNRFGISIIILSLYLIIFGVYSIFTFTLP